MPTNNVIKITDAEKELIQRLDHSLYTVEYLEEWINRHDNVFVNAPACLNAMAAHGYYTAIKQMVQKGV